MRCRRRAVSTEPISPRSPITPAPPSAAARSAMSRPLRTTPATGLGTADSRPRAGCATDGVTAAASRRMRSASPPAHPASVSARWCGSASRSTGRGRRHPTASSAIAFSIPVRPPGGSGTTSRQPTFGGRHRILQRCNKIGRQAVGHRQQEPAEPGEHRHVHAGHAQSGAPGAGHPRIGVQQLTVGRALGTGDVVAAGGHARCRRPRRGSAGRHGSRSGRSGCPSTAAAGSAGIGPRRSAASRTTSTPRR